MKNSYILDPHATRVNFEKAADTYDAHAVLQHEVAERLLERLHYIRLAPNRVLDLGCGTGKLTQQLGKTYTKAQIIAADLAINMLKKTYKRASWFRKPIPVCAAAEQLPFQSQSIDLLISNLMLQWCNDLPAVFKEFSRIMQPSGLLMFTTFGPDTLKELRQSWQAVDGFTHTSQFTDMHDIGDALLQSGFTQPVVDMEIITLTYENIYQLMKDLKKIGATNVTQGRNRGLMTKQRLRALEKNYENYRLDNGLYPATYEVIYGHAWSPESIKPEKFIPIQPIS